MTSNRIDSLFARCRQEERAALILYLTSGFPDAQTTRRLLPVLEQAGCDLVELGVPFSDPIADGPTIQRASAVALERGMSLSATLEIVSEFRRQSAMPLILFGAYNPFLRHGLQETAREAAGAGADGILAADLPIEEAAPFREACRANGLHLIALIAPTSPDARIAAIARSASGFLYCMALKGTTGARSAIGADVGPYLARVRRQTTLPLAVGFGIGKPEHVAAVGPHCDAVVVGSALIDLIGRCEREGLDLERTIERYVRSLAEALPKKIKSA